MKTAKIWSGIKSIINIKDQTSSSPTCIQQDNKLLTEPVDIANSFIKTYSSVADDILDKRKYQGDGNFKKFLPASSINTIRIDQTNETEICNIINSLSPKKSTGPNSIPSYILLYMQKELALPLTKLTNLSLLSGKHPNMLKIAKIVPIFKKGSKLKTSNYRPISLLPNINKIIEKIVYSRIFDFLSKK